MTKRENKIREKIINGLELSRSILEFQCSANGNVIKIPAKDL